MMLLICMETGEGRGTEGCPGEGEEEEESGKILKSLPFLFLF